MTRRTVFLMGLAGAAGCRRDQRPRLNVWNWSSYVAPETIPAFEREFNVRVRYGVYESNEEMLSRIMGGNSGWDVVFPTNYLIEPMRDQQLIARLDHRLLPNARHLEARFRRPLWDPNLDWSTPYMWTGAGIVYRRELYPAIQGWADLWDARLQGQITMLDDPVDVFGACLKKLGFSINTENEDELVQAQKEAIEQKELVRAYLNAEVRDQLVAGDVLAAQLWSTTSQQAIDESAELDFVYPSEGYSLYLDSAVILRESRRVRLAHDFLNYLLRPAVAASIAHVSRTATPNESAQLLLDASDRLNPTLYPCPAVLKRGEWARASPARIQRLRDRLWTEVKSA